MSLRDIHYKEDYRSGYDNFVDDFFAPSLRNSSSYWRAVGYFSSSSLEAFGAPLGEFVISGGEIRLVTSVELTEADIQAIDKGTAKKQVVCEQRIEEIIRINFSNEVSDGVALLAKLLEVGRLSIQIAVPKNGTGIYHEKIGLFFDDADFVAFTGSSNESRTAFENNRECFDVFTSWESESRASRKKEHFENLWNGEDDGVQIFSFPKAAEKELIRICRVEIASKSRRDQNQTISGGIRKRPSKNLLMRNAASSTWQPAQEKLARLSIYCVTCLTETR